MAKSTDDYSIFEVEEVVESRGPEYKEIIPKVGARYFFSNPRFRSLGQVSFPQMIDYLGIYEEGDRWTLTILEGMVNNAVKYLFLPLTEGMPLDPENNEYGKPKPAFGIETNSPFYGKRQWQVFDAFADELFHQKLYNLFLPWRDVPENHVNAYVSLQESGIGSFKFHTKYELKEPIGLKGGEVEFVESDLLLRFAEYSLRIYQTLPAIIDIQLLEESPEVAGWIEYAGEKGLHLLIGILYKASNEFHKENS